MENNKALIWDGNELKSATFDKNHSYEFLKSSVNGYIDGLYINDFADDVAVWINDEGKLRADFVPSALLMYNGKAYDYVVGNIVFTGISVDGETISLSDENIKKIKNYFANAVYHFHFDKNNFTMCPEFHY